MPIELPLRKASVFKTSQARETWGVALAAICFAVALAWLVSLTPPEYRAGYSAAVFETMLQSP